VQQPLCGAFAEPSDGLEPSSIRRGPNPEEQPLFPSTVDGVFRVLDLILGFAVTRGYRADNPVSRLSKAEKPKRKNVNALAEIAYQIKQSDNIGLCKPTWVPSCA
jgi:hypothetical protein